MLHSSPWRIRTSPISTVETVGAWSTRTPISPSAILTMTRSASSSKTGRSGVMIRQKSCRPSRRCSGASATLAYLAGLASLPGRGGRLALVRGVRPLGLRLGWGLFLLTADRTGLLNGLVDVAHKVEGLLGEVVVLALDDLLERPDRLVEVHELPFETRELLGDEERLGEETLQPARPADDDLVLLGELVYAEDGDDVLQLLVALQDVLDLLGDLVVLVAHNRGVEDRRGGGQRIHRRVDPLLGESTTKLHRRVKVGEHRERRRVGEVVSRDVDGLEARYRALLGGGDPLLQGPHLRAEGRLVANLGGHPAHQGGDLVTRLDEAEDVVHEKQHILALLLAEVLGHGDTRQRHPKARPRRLVHLAEDHRHVLEDAGLLHLAVEVVTLAGSLAHAGEDRCALILEGDVVYQLGDDDRLPDARAAEQTHLAAPPYWAEKVYDLDAGDELLRLGGEVLEARRGTVNRPVVVRVLDRTLLVHRLAQHVHHAPEHVLADGHRYGAARVLSVDSALEAVRRGHRNRADHVIAEELLDLEDQFFLVAIDAQRDAQGVVDLRYLLRVEADVYYRPLDLDDGPNAAGLAVRTVLGPGLGGALRPLRAPAGCRLFASWGACNVLYQVLGPVHSSFEPLHHTNSFSELRSNPRRGPLPHQRSLESPA